MPENAQTSLDASPHSSGPVIRSCALSGMIDQHRAENPRSKPVEVPRIAAEFVNPKPESLASLETYLDCFARIEHDSDPGLAIRSALYQGLGNMGLYGQSLVLSETLWEAIQRAQDGLGYFQSTGKISFGMRLDRFRISYMDGVGPAAEVSLDCQYKTGLLVYLIRKTPGYRDANLVVRFPRCKSHHERFFPDAVRVSAATHAVIEFDSDLLRRPWRQADSGLSAAVSRAMDTIGDGDPELSEVVRHLLAASIEEMLSPLSLRKISEVLSMPTRTLQFRLHQEGHSFAGLRNQTLHEAAKVKLRKGFSVTETALRLGYSQHQSFSEAFLRWEGVSPSVHASRGVTAP